MKKIIIGLIVIGIAGCSPKHDVDEWAPQFICTTYVPSTSSTNEGWNQESMIYDTTEMVEDEIFSGIVCCSSQPFPDEDFSEISLDDYHIVWMNHDEYPIPLVMLERENHKTCITFDNKDLIIKVLACKLKQEYRKRSQTTREE